MSDTDPLAGFMSLTGADSTSAVQYLDLTNWNLEEAVNLFLESGGQTAGGSSSGNAEGGFASAAYNDSYDQVRKPDPSKRQRLVGENFDLPPRGRRVTNQNFRDFAAESVAAITSMTDISMPAPFDVKSTTSSDTSDRSRDLNSLFQPPVHLMFHGTYSDARQQAKTEGKWLLVNLQDETVFASHMLNRDTWSDDVVQNVVASGFVFWQSYIASDHGKRFSHLYQLDQDSLPIVVIIDPRTGQKLAQWTGVLDPGSMIERLSDFCCSHSMESDTTTAYSNISASSSLARQQDITESSEEDQLAAAIAASLERQPMEEQNDTEMEMEEEMKEEEIVVETLPPEPADGVPDVTRVQIRTPDGSRLIRRFMKTDKISLLWTFVREQVPEARTRSFELRIAFPPSALAFSEVDTLADRKLENASLMVGWT